MTRKWLFKLILIWGLVLALLVGSREKVLAGCITGATHGPDARSSIDTNCYNSGGSVYKSFGKAVTGCYVDSFDNIEYCQWHIYFCEATCAELGLESCFPAGTQVKLKNGESRAIEGVLIGDDTSIKDPVSLEAV